MWCLVCESKNNINTKERRPREHLCKASRRSFVFNWKFLLTTHIYTIGSLYGSTLFGGGGGVPPGSGGLSIE